jgi:hypothetical protein
MANLGWERQLSHNATFFLRRDAQSCWNVRYQLHLQHGDLILDLQLAFFKTAQL